MITPISAPQISPITLNPPMWTCLRQQSMSNSEREKKRAKCLNEPENVMHLPKPLWWESTDSDECRIYVAIYVCCVTAEGAWPCSITWVNTSAEFTWDLPDVSLPPRSLLLSLLLLFSGVCWMLDFSLTRWSHYPWQFKSDRHRQVKDYQTMQCRKALR